MPASPTAAFRHASLADVDAIEQLLAEPAARGEILPRNRAAITEAIRDFIRAEIHGRTVGCVTLRDYGDGLYEVRSLVVDPAHRGHQLGTNLVEHAVRAARERGARSVFALTYHPRLFERIGFARVTKERFPQKVWTDCKACRKRDHCDEIAVLLQLGDVAPGIRECPAQS